MITSNVCLSTVGKKISAGKSKQTSTFLETRNSNTEIEFWASAYLFKFIDQWAPRNVAPAPNFLF